MGDTPGCPLDGKVGWGAYMGKDRCYIEDQASGQHHDDK
jgi:hypothetical protein